MKAVELYLGDDVLKLSLFPGICGMAHHGDDGVVKLFILVIEENKLRPQVSLLCGPQDLKEKYVKK